MSAPRASVFVSYSHEDRDLARRIASGLRNAGITAWLDEEQIKPGTDFAYTIQRALANADAVIFLISKSWTSSSHANLEVAAAVARSVRDEPIRIIPILIDKGVRPPPFLIGYAYLDIADRSLSDDDLRLLIESVTEERDKPTSETSRSAQRTELKLSAGALQRAQVIERERWMAQQSTFRIVLALTLLASSAAGIIAVATGSPAIAAAVLAPLTGLLGALIGFYFRSNREP